MRAPAVLGWIAEAVDTRTVHVWPPADEFEHDLLDPSACGCGPVVEEIAPGISCYTHTPLDGRT